MTSVLWRRLDQPGHEYVTLQSEKSGWLLSGVAVFEHEAQPCRLDYAIRCDEAWITRSADVSGWIGNRHVEATIVATKGRWTLNGQRCSSVDGCLDVDLNFSPSTNLLPIRRLNLAIGSEAAVRAAWLRFPSFTLEPLDQTYSRAGEQKFTYRSASFVADITTNADGLPLRYGEIWSADASLSAARRP